MYMYTLHVYVCHVATSGNRSNVVLLKNWLGWCQAGWGRREVVKGSQALSLGAASTHAIRLKIARVAVAQLVMRCATGMPHREKRESARARGLRDVGVSYPSSIIQKGSSVVPGGAGDLVGCSRGAGRRPSAGASPSSYSPASAPPPRRRPPRHRPPPPPSPASWRCRTRSASPLQQRPGVLRRRGRV